jgi:hypothetical protein
MRIKPESRGKLKEGVDKRKHGLDDRGKHMAKVVKEKKAIADSSHKLRFPTKEGAAEIKATLKKASVATDNEFKKQNMDLEKKHGECKKAEGDLSERTKIANTNTLEARKAASQIKEAKDAKIPIAQAEKASKDDAHFTNDRQGKQKRDRVRSETNRNNLKTQLMNTRLSF